MFNFPSKYNVGGDQDEQRKMQLLSLLADLKVTLKLLKVMILYPNVLQEENASLSASNDQHRAENALIQRRVDQLEERLGEKDGKTSEE